MSNKRSHIVFLDIDGVLNSIEWANEKAKLYYHYPGFQENFNQSQFCPTLVAELEHIMMAVPKAKIVISSSWRVLHKLSEIQGFITNAGGMVSSERIIGKTCYMRNRIRGLEIKQWVDKFKPERYVILDDLDEMTDEQKANGHFIETDDRVGLTRADADRAITILNS